MLVGGFGIAFYLGPYLTLIALAYLPLFMGAGAALGITAGISQKKKLT